MEKCGSRPVTKIVMFTLLTFYFFAKLIAEKERGACALIADQVSNNTTIHVLEKYSASEIAKSIRARGQA